MLPHHALIAQLTPDLSPEGYQRLLRAMVPHQYAQAVVVEGEATIAVSGYWIGHKLYCGKYLEVDNFVVDRSYRSRGVGQLLLEWMLEEAKRLDCQHVMLDAYVENEAAHRFYERNGFIKRGFHFLKEV